MKGYSQWLTPTGNRAAIGGILACALIFHGCNPEKRLERTIKNQLETGVRNDSLFLGLEFGMSFDQFYDHCWELNRQGIVKEGAQNMSVQYIFKDSLDNPIAFDFYGHRNEDGDSLIHQYNTTFYYYAWALNRHLYADNLIKMLNPILMDWYGGNDFFAVEQEGKVHLFKIDGNRMIDMFIYSESTVIATFTDLSHKYNTEQKQ
jgi:hypothetical protein